MTAFEKDVIERLSRIEERITRDYHVLYGNGKPGLQEEVKNITRRVDTLEVKAKESTNQTHTIAAVCAFIVNGAIAIYAAIKNHI